MADLQRAGDIRYFGISNFKAWRIARICAICDAEGIDRPVVDQPLYHALNRSVEVEVLPACRALGIGVVSYSPTARGILSGKYAKDAPPPEGSRARLAEQAHDGDRIPARKSCRGGDDHGLREEARMRARRLRDGLGACQSHRHRRDCRPAHDGAVAGYLAALDIAWTEDDEAFVASLVPAGHDGRASVRRPGLSGRREAAGLSLRPQV